jgi:hypothetical protein
MGRRDHEDFGCGIQQTNKDTSVFSFSSNFYNFFDCREHLSFFSAVQKFLKK